MKRPIPPSHCACCGSALDATPITYHRWQVCTVCYATLTASTASQSQVKPEPQAQSHKPKRWRCNLCYQLCDRDYLQPFTAGDRTIDIHARVWRKLVCTDCTDRLLQRCCDCGRPGAVYSEYGRRDGVVKPIAYRCTACYDRYAARRAAAAAAHTPTNPAAELARIAGVALPDPCDAEALKRLWKAAARRTHPDAGGSHIAFIAAKRCYETALQSQGVR